MLSGAENSPVPLAKIGPSTTGAGLISSPLFHGEVVGFGKTSNTNRPLVSAGMPSTANVVFGVLDESRSPHIDSEAGPIVVSDADG